MFSETANFQTSANGQGRNRVLLRKRLSLKDLIYRVKGRVYLTLGPKKGF